MSIPGKNDYLQLLYFNTGVFYYYIVNKKGCMYLELSFENYYIPPPCIVLYMVSSLLEFYTYYKIFPPRYCLIKLISVILTIINACRPDNQIPPIAGN